MVGHIWDIVNRFMKNRSGTYGKTRQILPLEGGGKRVGVKGLTSIAKDVGNTLRIHSGLCGDISETDR